MELFVIWSGVQAGAAEMKAEPSGLNETLRVTDGWGQPAG